MGDGDFACGCLFYSAGGSGSNAVMIADVNGEGKPNLLVANCNTVEMVMFTTGNMVLGSVALSGGRVACTTSAIPGGTHVVKAIYAGDSTFASSTGTVTQVVDKYATATALVSSLNPSDHGQDVTFTRDGLIVRAGADRER